MPRAGRKIRIGLKELWEVPKEKHRPGLVQHTMGWPLGDSTGGGSFLYHFGENLVSVGFVVHLDYPIPTSTRSRSFSARSSIRASPRICKAAGASPMAPERSPKRLAGDPSPCLSGRCADRCAAGFMNVPRIKCSHNAMLSGMMAARSSLRRSSCWAVA